MRPGRGRCLHSQPLPPHGQRAVHDCTQLGRRPSAVLRRKDVPHHGDAGGAGGDRICMMIRERVCVCGSGCAGVERGVALQDTGTPPGYGRPGYRRAPLVACLLAAPSIPRPCRERTVNKSTRSRTCSVGGADAADRDDRDAARDSDHCRQAVEPDDAGLDPAGVRVCLGRGTVLPAVGTVVRAGRYGR